MIYWNDKTLKSRIGSLIWNHAEYFKIPLGRFAPIVFGWMINSKPHKVNKIQEEK